MGNLKSQTLHMFYKRKSNDTSDNCNQENKRSKPSTSEPQQQQNESKEIKTDATRPNTKEADSTCLERDPGKRQQLWEYPVNEREELRRAYLNEGPFQIHLKEYPHKVQRSILPNVRHGSDTFTFKGFNNWKKVNDGKNCSFLKHIGCSQHRNAVACCENLLNQTRHIEKIIEKRSMEQVLKNRIRLKASIDIVRWLTFQTCAFRGNDESKKSINRGNFIEMLKLLASYNDELAQVVLENAHFNSKYTSGDIQKEILNIIANRVRRHIRSEVGNSYFCVMVDESRDESKKEQMAIVLRFVDKDGIIRERFLDLAHVSDTSALTLKRKLWKRLLRYEFDTSNIRGQGYDGASNMRGEWNGLQALVARDCPYAYYVHCFAHRLQLALVAASRDVIPVHQFFTNLTNIINVICGSSKRHDELQKAKAAETKRLLELGEIKKGKGANQVTTLRRAGDTRWGSHFLSVSSLLKMYNPTRIVLEGIIEDGSYAAQCGDADGCYTHLKSFEFVFILHLINEIMGRTDILSKALQKKSLDIGNAMELVSATKESLNNFRNNGWEWLIRQVTTFCEKHKIDMPDMNAPYKSSRYRPRRQDNHVTFEHYYRVDIFICTLDKQLHEMAFRFNDEAIELLTLSSALIPKKDEVLNVDKIVFLVEKYYPADFTEQERFQLRYELEMFNIARSKNSKLSGASTIARLCEILVEIEKHKTYHLVDRLFRLILTLPVSTATTERGFSAMKICKNRLRNRMSDDFLADSLLVHIEKDIAEMFDSTSIIDEFKNLKGRRADL